MNEKKNYQKDQGLAIGISNKKSQNSIPIHQFIIQSIENRRKVTFNFVFSISFLCLRFGINRFDSLRQNVCCQNNEQFAISFELFFIYSYALILNLN